MIIHETSHAGLKTSEAEAKELENCAERNLSREESIPEDQRLKPKSAGLINGGFQWCRTVPRRTCRDFLLTAPPDVWFDQNGNVTTKEEDEEASKEWCGVVGIEYGSGGMTATLSVFVCLNRPIQICWRTTETLCGGLGYAPARAGALAAATCKEDPPRTCSECGRRRDMLGPACGDLHLQLKGCCKVLGVVGPLDRRLGTWEVC